MSPRSRYGPHDKQPHRLLKPLQRRLPPVDEAKPFPSTQVPHDLRRQHLPGARLRTNSCGQLHGTAEVVVVLRDRLPRVQANPYRHLGSVEHSLNLCRGLHRRRRR